MRILFPGSRPVTVCLLLFAIPSIYMASRPITPLAAAPGVYQPVPEDPQKTVPDSLLELLVQEDPFRVARRPAPQVFGESVAAIQMNIEEAPPKPVLNLTGLVWGSDPVAVIEGLPESTGPRLLGVGESLGPITIQRISAGEVVVEGMDTTWTLTVREP